MAKTKALISCAVTAQLIYVFVFAYANRWFSHAKADIKVGYDEGLYISWTCYTDGLHQENMSEK